MASVHKQAVGIFPDRPKTASALQALSDSGFSMGHVSVIARDPKREADIAGIKVRGEVGNQADTGGAVGAIAGGVLGGVTGLLAGIGIVTIPGIGPALVAGEAAAALLSTLIGGAAGAAAGGLLGALIGLGIPEHRAKRYHDRVLEGDYLVMLKDRESEIARAERTLKAAGIEDWGVYEVPEDSHTSQPNPSQAGQFQADPQSEKAFREAVSDEGAPSTHATLAREGTMGVYEEEAYRDEHGDRPSDLYLDHRDDYFHPANRPHGTKALGVPFEETTSKEESQKQVDNRVERPIDGRLRSDQEREVLVSKGTEETHQWKEGEDDRRAIGVFQSQARMEDALSQLKETGFPLHTLSILVRESESRLPAEQVPTEQMPTEQQQSSGHPLSGAANLTSGVDRLKLPEIGSTLAMGPDSQTLSDMLHEGKFYGLIELLENLGIAREAATLYSRHLTDGSYLITVKGNNPDVLHAASTLGQHGMLDWGIFDTRRQ